MPLHSISRRGLIQVAVISIFSIFCIYNIAALRTNTISRALTSRPESSKTKIPLRLLPIGDSITEGYGSSDKNGFRLRLKNLLIDTGETVDFIGALHNGENNTDNRHEGYGAHDIDQIYARVVDDEILDQRPNLVLLHAGTNDMDRAPPDAPYDLAPERLFKLVDLVFYKCPETVMLLALIIHDHLHSAQPRVEKFNAALPALVESRTRKGWKIKLVDHSGLGDPYLVDGIHPTDEGYVIMAETWFKAFKSLPEGWIIPAQ